MRFSKFFTVIIFLASFLSFSVQPLFSKLILPILGGGSSVWTTTSFFFQFLLLVSYIYLFLLERIKFRYQVIIHLGIALVTLLAIQPFFDVQFSGALLRLPFLLTNTQAFGSEVLTILRIGIVTVGISFLFLGTISAFIQMVSIHVGIKNPYLFYRASNLGSLLGLFAYVFLIEPFFPSHVFVNIWSYLVFILVSVIAVICIVLIKQNINVKDVVYEKSSIPLGIVLKLILLSAYPVALMLSVTNMITQGIAPIPFLWILPFGAYLISFILAFGNTKLNTLYVVSSIFLCWIGLLGMFFELSEIYEYLFYVGVLILIVFLLSYIMHRQVYELRPNSKLLSLFYLYLSVGGLLGGLFVSVIAPIIFTSYIEFYLMFLIGLIICLFIYYRSELFVVEISANRFINIQRVPLVLISALVFFVSICGFYAKSLGIIYQGRNFYGVVTVSEKGIYRVLNNGKILHGSQITNSSTISPTSYYSVSSGLGKSIEFLRSSNKNKSLNVGVVGLGAGTIAAYCQTNDKFVFYEINPLVIGIAKKHFTYLDYCKDVKVVQGDARISLKNEELIDETDKYDILVIDAFTDDSIPIHLITAESNAIYLEHIKKNGLLLYHTSNRYLNLDGVVNNFAVNSGLGFAVLYDDNISQELQNSPSRWLIIGPNDVVVQISQLMGKNEIKNAKLIKWTDDHHNIFDAIIW